MSVKENKDVVKRFVKAAFEQFDGEAMDRLVTDDFHAHPWAPFGIPDGPEGMRSVVSVLSTVFSNPHVVVEDIVAEGDKVVMRYIFEADHTGTFMGAEATGKRVRLPGILMARMEGEKLAEYWREENQLGLLYQIGALPAPGA